MSSYTQLLLLILPVFGVLGVGTLLRRVGWLTAEADSSLLKVVVNFLYPCLIFENVVQNEALRDPSNLLLAPLLGFSMMSLAIVASYGVAKMIGFGKGTGLRTFAFSTGINNYGYIPIPLMAGLFGQESVGLLLVHNVGCEAAVWTTGIFVLSGLSLKEGWRKLLNAPLFALVIAVIGNLTHIGPHIPAVVREIIHQCAVCAVPLGLILIGAVLAEFLKPRDLMEPRTAIASILLRLAVFPVAFLLVAVLLPVSHELKRVIVVQGAMPTGILLIVIAKHYGGHTLTSVRAVVATTAVGIFAIPFWLKVGLSWIKAP